MPTLLRTVTAFEHTADRFGRSFCESQTESPVEAETTDSPLFMPMEAERKSIGSLQSLIISRQKRSKPCFIGSFSCSVQNCYKLLFLYGLGLLYDELGLTYSPPSASWQDVPTVLIETVEKLSMLPVRSGNTGIRCRHGISGPENPMI